MSFNAGAAHLLRLRPLTEVDERGYICAAKKLVKEGFQLKEDEDRIVEACTRRVNLWLAVCFQITLCRNATPQLEVGLIRLPITP